MKNADWWVYIIRTQDNQLYTGITTNVQKRWLAHCAGTGAKYFRAHTPLEIVFLEPCVARGPATQREYALKQLKKANKEQLITALSEQTLGWMNELGISCNPISNNLLRDEDAA